MDMWGEVTRPWWVYPIIMAAAFVLLAVILHLLPRLPTKEKEQE